MKRILLAFAVLVPQVLPAQPSGELEARLAGATGRQRLELLAEVGEAWLEEDPAKALTFANQAVELARELDDPPASVAALRHAGEAHERLGDSASALDAFRRSLRLAREIGEPQETARNLFHIGDIHRREGRLAPAAETLRRGLAAASEIDAKEEIRDVSHALAETYAAMGRHRDAYASLERYDEVRNELETAAPAGAPDRTPDRELENRRQQLESEVAELRRQLAERETTPREAGPREAGPREAGPREAGSSAIRRLAAPALGLGTLLLVGLVLALYSRHRLAAQSALALAERDAALGDAAAELGALEERTHGRIAELEAENAEAQRRISEQERYTTLISHDLKIPLIAIHGFLGLLQQDAMAGDAARLRKDVERIQGLVGKMASLLDRLLELSRIGPEVESPQEVSLAELAREAVEMVASQIASRQVEVAISPNLPVVWGDRPRLLEVLQNLIANAVKFMGPQTAPRVEIGWEVRDEPAFDGTDDAGPIYFVRDNGIGIESHHQQTVFGLFERLDQAKEGHGIGLALVQRIVEAHGGRVWVESEGAGEGSTFCFTLAPADPPGGGEWETRPGIEPPGITDLSPG